MKLKDLENKPPNLLLGGASGSGKTALIMQLHKGHVMDFDGNVRSVLTVEDDFVNLRQQTNFETYVDDIEMLSGAAKLVSAQYLRAKSDLIDIAKQCREGKWPYNALCIDTITGLCKAIKLHCMSCAGSAFKKPQIQHYGDMINELEAFLSIMRAIPVLKITTAHEMILFGTKDEAVGSRFMSATKPHGANELSWRFDQVLFAKKRMRGQGRVDYMVTGKHELCKGPITGDLVHNEIGLAGILDKLGYKYE